jgi:3-hydroxyacyl-[acyl-carrier-protein] dehydratase
MPESLMIEAMAQTSGILVGEAKDFSEKVILAKIKKAVFFDYVKPGDTIKLDAKIESIAPEAASTSGKITCGQTLIAEIDLMFSHIDQNLAGKEFPEENFVFTETFKSLLQGAFFIDNKLKAEQR